MLKKICFILTISLFVISCKSAKVSNNTIANVSAKSIIKKNDKVKFDKQTVKANLVVSYRGKFELPALKTSLRMVKDSVIWMSFSKLGFPVAKLMITPNRVLFYEKLNKRYFDGDFTFINKALGTTFGFQEIQNLLIGEALVNLKNEKYNVQIESSSYVLQAKKDNPLYLLSFWINPKNFKLTKEVLQHRQKEQYLSISYQEYIEKDNVLFPKKIKLEAVNKKDKTTVDFVYKNVIFDATFTTPFTVPDSYQKIELK